MDSDAGHEVKENVILTEISSMEIGKLICKALERFRVKYYTQFWSLLYRKDKILVERVQERPG